MIAASNRAPFPSAFSTPPNNTFGCSDAANVHLVVRPSHPDCACLHIFGPCLARHEQLIRSKNCDSIQAAREAALSAMVHQPHSWTIHPLSRASCTWPLYIPPFGHVLFSPNVFFLAPVRSVSVLPFVSRFVAKTSNHFHWPQRQSSLSLPFSPPEGGTGNVPYLWTTLYSLFLPRKLLASCTSNLFSITLIIASAFAPDAFYHLFYFFFGNFFCSLEASRRGPALARLRRERGVLLNVSAMISYASRLERATGFQPFLHIFFFPHPDLSFPHYLATSHSRARPPWDVAGRLPWDWRYGTDRRKVATARAEALAASAPLIFSAQRRRTWLLLPFARPPAGTKGCGGASLLPRARWRARHRLVRVSHVWGCALVGLWMARINYGSQ